MTRAPTLKNNRALTASWMATILNLFDKLFIEKSHHLPELVKHTHIVNCMFVYCHEMHESYLNMHLTNMV